MLKVSKFQKQIMFSFDPKKRTKLFLNFVLAPKMSHTKNFVILMRVYLKREALFFYLTHLSPLVQMRIRNFSFEIS